MDSKLSRLLSLLMIVSLMACTSNSDQKIVTQEVLDELASREIKKVTDPQLFTSGYRIAQEIRDSVLNLSEDTIVEQGLLREGIYFELLTLDTTDLDEQTDQIKTIVESYNYSLKEKLPIGDNISDYSRNQLIYSDLIQDVEACEKLGDRKGTEECVFLLLMDKKVVVESLE